MTHDIDTVTDRYLRRFDTFVPLFDDVWPRDSFHWANARLGIASRRVVHAARNAVLPMRHLERVTARATEAIRAFTDALR